MSKIWVVSGRSESGDDYVIGYWDHSPSDAEVKKAFNFDDEWEYFLSWDRYELGSQDD
jgi:hypothetical protein